MPTELNSYSSFWTIVTLVILFGMIPAILFILGRAATAGSHPEKEQMDEVKTIAVSLNEASEALLTEATRVFSSAPGERQALEALIQFADTAESFRVLVLGPVRSPARTRRAFEHLVMEFGIARRSFPALKAYRHCRDRMDVIERKIDELKFFYEASQTTQPGHRRAAPSPDKNGPVRRPEL